MSAATDYIQLTHAASEIDGVIDEVYAARGSYGNLDARITAKQDELTAAQQAAVDSGITAAKLAEDEADIATLKGYHAINTISSSAQSPADVDNYKDTGFYIVTSSSVAATIAHAPFTAAGFTLEVAPSYQVLGSTRGVIQTATSYVSGSTTIKKRWYLYGSGAWSWTDWEIIGTGTRSAPTLAKSAEPEETEPETGEVEEMR